MNNAEYKSIYMYLASGKMPTTYNSTKSNFKKKANKFTIKYNKLYRGDKAVVKHSEQQKVFHSTPDFNTFYNFFGIVFQGR